eukprot:GHVR01174653.1.p1 GENE.GHVR01174653.1~~GHVR01174653.1.p1  ORF type:complete len:100 (+),score=7.14 GHVR01174653.1:412-711(+)
MHKILIHIEKTQQIVYVFISIMESFSSYSGTSYSLPCTPGHPLLRQMNQTVYKMIPSSIMRLNPITRRDAIAAWSEAAISEKQQILQINLRNVRQMFQT